MEWAVLIEHDVTCAALLQSAQFNSEYTHPLLFADDCRQAAGVMARKKHTVGEISRVDGCRRALAQPRQWSPTLPRWQRPPSHGQS